MFLQARLSLPLILSAAFKGTLGGSPPAKKEKQQKNSEVPPLPYKYIGTITEAFLKPGDFEKTHLALLREKIKNSCFSPQALSGLKKRNS